MKKSLVLAMAMALGVTASAYAANPFSDVPAGHWAYDSISKLAAAGVIEGYGDDTFRGDRLMTRYEMAQIVAKAMAKGANVDKLAAEFADELDALGVRVAALEKKSDNVRITGQLRWAYQSNKFNGAKTHSHRLRSRLWFNGTVNPNWKYVGMVQNEQDLTDNVGNDNNFIFQRAYLEGRLGGLKTVAGRFNKARLPGGDMYGTRMDGVDFTYGKQVKINAFYGKPTDATRLLVEGNQANRYMGINVSADLGKVVNVYAGYDYAKQDYAAVEGTDKIFDIGAKFKLGKKASLAATYLHAKLDGATAGSSKNGFLIDLSYGGAKANKVGSWGIGAKYYHLPAGGFVHNGWEAINSPYNTAMFSEGMKGYYLKADYTFAKNMRADIEYWDVKGRVNNVKNKALFTGIYVTF